MMVALLVAGVAFLLVGLLAIASGLPIQEFSFGNTLILAGAVTACTGAMMLGLWVVVRELRTIARRLVPGHQAELQAETALQAAVGRARPRDQAAESGGFPFNRDLRAAEDADHAGPAALPTSPPPWYDEASPRERARGDAPEFAEAAPAAKPRRNLLFSSSRKERERASARTADPSDLDSGPADATLPPESGEAPPATFDDAWPRPERARAAEAPLRRSARAPSTFTEAGATGADRYPPASRNEEAPQVTVLKSGIVDGMAYSLYSDGSIEAEMPEGTMRFASIDELRKHLDQRS
jgi:hypothetical protein